VGDHSLEQQSAREQSVIRGIDMSPRSDNALTQIQDLVSPVEDHPPEQQDRPSEEQSGVAIQSESAFVPAPLKHEGKLKEN